MASEQEAMSWSAPDSRKVWSDTPSVSRVRPPGRGSARPPCNKDFICPWLGGGYHSGTNLKFVATTFPNWAREGWMESVSAKPSSDARPKRVPGILILDLGRNLCRQLCPKMRILAGSFSH